MANRLTRSSTRGGPLFPGLASLRGYRRSWLRGDVLGGITVAAYLVPQVMAYAAVAGLPPTTGLSAALPALVVYAFLGSSRQLSVGPESTTALMTAAAIGGMAAQDTDRYAAAAAALAIAVGVLCFFGRLLRFGFVADLLSRPVLIGYLAGVAVLMITSQLDTLTGVVITAEEPLEQVRYILTHLDQVNGPTALLATLVAGSLLVVSNLRPHWPLPLIAMLLAAAATALLDLEERGIATVGTVSGGLPVPDLPGVSWSVMAELALPAIGVAVVGYTDNVLTGRAFASQHHEHVDADQELLALGAANVASGFTQGFPVSSSGSRTAIADALGVRTQLHSLVAVAAVVVTLLAFRPALEAFPQAALAGVVVYAAVRLVDTEEMGRIARFRSSELVLTAATTVGVLLLGVLAGIGVAVALSILDLLRRVARAHDGILGFVPGLAGMHDVDDHADAATVEGLVVYRYDSPLFFANAEDFRSRCLEAVESAPSPVEWLLVNMEANVEVDLTALDALEDLRADLDARGVTVALARVKNDLQVDLDRYGLTDHLGAGRIYPTLPTAVAAYAEDFALRHGRPPEGLPTD